MLTITCVMITVMITVLMTSFLVFGNLLASVLNLSEDCTELLHLFDFSYIFFLDQKLEDLIREGNFETADTDRRVAELEKVNKTHEENALKRDKAIQGLVYEVNKKIKEVRKFG